MSDLLFDRDVLARELGHLNRLLSEACYRLDCHNGAYWGSASTPLREWWHKEKERKRAEKQERIERQAALRAQAFAKLTTEEIKALGLTPPSVRKDDLGGKDDN